MWYTKDELIPFRNFWVENFQNYITSFIGKEWEGISLVVVGLSLMIVFFFILDFIIKRILLFFTIKIVSSTQTKWDNHFFEMKVFNSIFHLIPLGITRIITPYILYPTPEILNEIRKIFDIAFILVLLQLFFRITNALLSISTDENNYRTVAVKSFGQLMKLVSIFFVVLIIISILFDVKLQNILTGLGAATAILLLIFRDSILGFVSGIQIASTRMVKVGDWISVQKYKVEGTVQEINLVSCKIANFDKTISSIPTYELIATEVKNYEAMRNTNTRRIKRSIVFNAKSFEFCGNETLENYKKIDRIADYISEKQRDLKVYNQKATNNDTVSVNGRRLTNIGTFRKYAENYLRSHPNISQNDTLMVRQLEISPQGMPLEIYCFTNTSIWVEFEAVQADIFDHLVTASKEFGLEVVQTIPTN